MPRTLTEQEKCRICDRLFEKGREIVLSQGIKRISVDDIVKAAGIAKGSFYQHFESKEKFLFALIEKIHRQLFTQAEQMIKDSFSNETDLHENARTFIKNLFHMPEMAFFTKNEHNIEEIFFGFMGDEEIRTFKQMEVELFEKMLKLAGADTARVKPGVVHNYIHTLYLMMNSDLMTTENLLETVDLITDSLISYILSSARRCTSPGTERGC